MCQESNFQSSEWPLSLSSVYSSYNKSMVKMLIGLFVTKLKGCIYSPGWVLVVASICWYSISLKHRSPSVSDYAFFFFCLGVDFFRSPCIYEINLLLSNTSANGKANAAFLLKGGNESHCSGRWKLPSRTKRALILSHCSCTQADFL